MIYYEDVEIGQKRSFGSYEVTREEVLDFARKYDPQPFHLSDEAAAKTHFGRLAASGWHTCAMTMSMLVKHLQANPEASQGAAGIEELRWLKPVFPGDTLRGESEVLEKRELASKPGMGMLTTQTTTFNQHGEPVMRFSGKILMRKRPLD
ncbi:MaoC family dehydratase [Sphingomonas sp.]|uniref:MaoC family dehydratase n=1 Tax=Sphingomonas sp. TaxID=28214 RepID=UPI001B054AC1|nr:MaoC family dehydratase [Sphingomonas sp.]MBO9713631.1 MaoC family dehydratase [Sphingomonas sp.]